MNAVGIGVHREMVYVCKRIPVPAGAKGNIGVHRCTRCKRCKRASVEERVCFEASGRAMSTVRFCVETSDMAKSHTHVERDFAGMDSWMSHGQGWHGERVHGLILTQ